MITDDRDTITKYLRTNKNTGKKEKKKNQTKPNKQQIFFITIRICIRMQLYYDWYYSSFHYMTVETDMIII